MGYVYDDKMHGVIVYRFYLRDRDDMQIILNTYKTLFTIYNIHSMYYVYTQVKTRLYAASPSARSQESPLPSEWYAYYTTIYTYYMLYILCVVLLYACVLYILISMHVKYCVYMRVWY